MTVKTVARRCEVPDYVVERANRKIGKLVRFEPRLASAEVVFRIERHVHRVEAFLSLNGQDPVVARGEARDFPTALDQVADRLSKILRRGRTQQVEHWAGR